MIIKIVLVQNEGKAPLRTYVKKSAPHKHLVMLVKVSRITNRLRLQTEQLGEKQTVGPAQSCRDALSRAAIQNGPCNPMT